MFDFFFFLDFEEKGWFSKYRNNHIASTGEKMQSYSLTAKKKKKKKKKETTLRKGGKLQKKGKNWERFFHMPLLTSRTLCYCPVSNVHLAQLIPWRFLKPAVCKYPITVIKSEMYILLPKPYSLMWHLVHGNRVKNGRDRRPETSQMCSPKVTLLKISMDSVQYNTEHCGINDDTDDEHSI